MFICSLRYLQSSIHHFSYMKYQRCFLYAVCLNQKDLQFYLSEAFDQDWLLLHNCLPNSLASVPKVGKEALSDQLKSYQKAWIQEPETPKKQLWKSCWKVLAVRSLFLP